MSRIGGGLLIAVLTTGLVVSTALSAGAIAAQGLRRTVASWQQQNPRLAAAGPGHDLSDYAEDPLMLLYARMIWSENRNYQGDYWLAAAIISAWTARNRLADAAFYNVCPDYPPGLRCVLLKETQFHGLWQVAARDPLGTTDGVQWPASVEIAVRVWHADIPDPTGGATRFREKAGVLEWGLEEGATVLWTRLADPNRQVLDGLRRRGVRLPAAPE